MNKQNTSAQISIIVPLYNCGNGTIIENLVESVINQTAQSWELLLCNDGSTDNTLELCNQISARDSRIRTIDNPHRGVSATRNSGLANATGEWITFVDADDHLTGCFLESMLTGAKREQQADMVCCSYMILCNNSAEANLYSDSIYSGIDSISKLFGSTDFLKRCSPWARMFRREIIQDHNIRFEERLSHSEDRLFIYDYLHHVNTIVTSSVIGYIYESFSSTSLKHKTHPFEMLILRQNKLTKSAQEVMALFKINKDAGFQFVNNLLNLLLDGAQSLNRQFGKNRAIELQRKLIECTYDIEDLLKSNSRIISKINKNALLSDLLNGNLNKFNQIQNRQDMILKIKQKIRRLFCIKDKAFVYSNYIHTIN